MGRIITPRYAVRMTATGCKMTDACWPTQHAGRPTTGNLAAYIAKLEASTLPGGCNAHLGPLTVTSATIVTNDAYKTVVATFAR